MRDSPARRLIGSGLNALRATHVDYSGVALKARIGRGVSVMAGSRIDQLTEIGAHSYIGFNCFISRAKIGRYVSIANNVSVGPGEHPLGRISTSSAFYGDVYGSLVEKECVVGNDVWIGVDCIIRRGVNVGDGAVIGANSFVSSDVPPFAVVAGSPAKVVRVRLTPEQQAVVIRSRWWELEPGEAGKLLAKMERDLGLEAGGDVKG